MASYTNTENSGSQENIATFQLSTVRPCADNEGMVYLEGIFENISIDEISEILTKRDWETLTMPSTGGVVARKDGMLLVLSHDLSFHLNNSATEEDALQVLNEIID